MSNSKAIKVITNKDAFKALAKKFEGAGNSYAKMQQELIYSYIPSAIYHYLAKGNNPEINRLRGVAVLTRSISTFGKLVDPMACSPFNKETGKFYSVAAYVKDHNLDKLEAIKLTKKFKLKRKNLLGVAKGQKEARWLVKYRESVARLENTNDKNTKKSFDENFLALVKRVSSMAESEESKDSKLLTELQALAELAAQMQPKLESIVHPSKG